MKMALMNGQGQVDGGRKGRYRMGQQQTGEDGV